MYNEMSDDDVLVEVKRVLDDDAKNHTKSELSRILVEVCTRLQAHLAGVPLPSQAPVTVDAPAIEATLREHLDIAHTGHGLAVIDGVEKAARAIHAMIHGKP